jgi:hypothetical protein
MKLLNYLYNIIKPALPTLQEAKTTELLHAQEALHKLELHHLGTLEQLEHYVFAKAELELRIKRLTCPP